MIEQKQSELLPATIRERIEAAARRFQEREDKKARRRLANMKSGARTDLPGANSHEVSLEQASTLLNVGRRSVADAKLIEEKVKT